MALEPIETAQLWVATVAGLAGLAGFLWQVFQHFSGRKEESNRSLNRNVLKPWSEIRINSLYDNDQHNRIALVVPKEALPADVVPSTGEKGLDIHRLPGLAKGEVFLRRHYFEVFSHWVEVKAKLALYENLLRRRRTLVEPKVRAGMSEFYPNLVPVPSWKAYKVNTYVLSHVVADVESIGYWASKDGELRLRVEMSKTQEDVLYCEYRAGSSPWLKVTEENALDIDKLTERVSSWITDAEVRQVNKELFECFQKLEQAIDRFQTTLKEATVNVEIAGE